MWAAQDADSGRRWENGEVGQCCGTDSSEQTAGCVHSDPATGLSPLCPASLSFCFDDQVLSVLLASACGWGPSEELLCSPAKNGALCTPILFLSPLSVFS